MLGVNPSAQREANDFYATDPYAIYSSEYFFDYIGLNKNIWEPACGLNHLVAPLKFLGYNVKATDIVKRGNMTDEQVVDFLSPSVTQEKWYGDILTNPPFKLAPDFIRQADSILDLGRLSVFLLKIQFLETPKRATLFDECGLKYVGVFSERICCAMNGEFNKYFKQDIFGRYKGGTQLYAWFVFQKGYIGEPKLYFIGHRSNV